MDISLHSLTYKTEIRTMETISAPVNQINCRICLQKMKNQQLYGYCKCKGSNQNIHEECMIEWIKNCKQFKQKGISYVLCDICKEKVYFEYSQKLQCMSMAEIKQNIFVRKLKSTLFTLSFLLAVIATFIIIMYLSQYINTQLELIIFAVGVVVTSVIIIVTIILFIKKNLFKKKEQISKIITKQNVIDKLQDEIGFKQSTMVHIKN